MAQEDKYYLAVLYDGVNSLTLNFIQKYLVVSN